MRVRVYNYKSLCVEKVKRKGQFCKKKLITHLLSLNNITLSPDHIRYRPTWTGNNQRFFSTAVNYNSRCSANSFLFENGWLIYFQIHNESFWNWPIRNSFCHGGFKHFFLFLRTEKNTILFFTDQGSLDRAYGRIKIIYFRQNRQLAHRCFAWISRQGKNVSPIQRR